VPGPLTPHGLRVCAEPCTTCVFRPGNLMHLNPGRLRGMIDASLAADSFITCHQTLTRETAEQAVCRGFYDRHRGDTLACRLGQLFGLVEVTP
jgi:hypothetical protein